MSTNPSTTQLNLQNGKPKKKIFFLRYEKIKRNFGNGKLQSFSNFHFDIVRNFFKLTFCPLMINVLKCKVFVT